MFNVFVEFSDLKGISFEGVQSHWVSGDNVLNDLGRVGVCSWTVARSHTTQSI